MGHAISAVVVAGSVNLDRARAFDTKMVPCLAGFTLIALDADYMDVWADKLNIHGDVADRPLANTRAVHHMIREIAGAATFAVIETDYFGGVGQQSAAVYRGEEELMAPETADYGVINSALRLLGVPRRSAYDEFESLGLGNYRDWGDLFNDYRDT